MIRRTRILAGTAIVALLVTGSLAVDSGITVAHWSAAANFEGAPTITTGSLGISRPTRTLARPATVSRITWGALEMYEIDHADDDWITLTTHATPTITGTGLGAVVESNFRWNTVSLVGDWTGVNFSYSAASSTQTVTPVSTGTPTSATQGVTLSVLALPVGSIVPTGWREENVVWYSGSPPEISFSLQIHNAGHDGNFILGGPDRWYWFALLWWIPQDAAMGSATVSATQIDASGRRGRWTHSEQVPLPIIYNASDTRTYGGDIVVTTLIQNLVASLFPEPVAIDVEREGFEREDLETQRDQETPDTSYLQEFLNTVKARMDTATQEASQQPPEPESTDVEDEDNGD